MEGMNFIHKESEPKIEILGNYEKFFPDEFKKDPLHYIETYGINIKSGEKKFDEEGRLREDPDAVKDLPEWEKDGEKLRLVAKLVNRKKVR